MEQNIGQMVAGRIQPEELGIEDVREGGKWMPVARVRLGEGQTDPVVSKARGDDGIFVNVILIVVSDELVPEGLAKDQPDKTR